MTALTNALEGFNRIAGGILLPLFLLGAGFLLLLGTRAAPLFAVRTLWKRDNDKRALRALSMALAGTLGVGNITGVALAIAMGGAGAIFWMWVSAPAAMILKYAEITLAMAHRKGTRGGAMYYIRDTIGNKTGTLLSALFALLCLCLSFTMGSMLQASAAAQTLCLSMHASPISVGILFAVAVAIVIFGGGKKISSVTSFLIPLLTIIYILVSLWIILANYAQLPSVLLRIVREGFTPMAAGGGAVGILLPKGIRYGITRSLVSNEAGAGTAPMAHATADTGSPARQGLLGVAEVFIDTVLLSTLTALVILLAFDTIPTADGVTIAITAYQGGIGRAAVPFIAGAVTFFAFATVICWAYYGESGLCYFTSSPVALLFYRLLFVASVALGALFTPDAVWGLTDLFLALLSFINIFTLLCAGKEIARLTQPLRKQKRKKQN